MCPTIYPATDGFMSFPWALVQSEPQPFSGFELGSTISSPTTITVMLNKLVCNCNTIQIMWNWSKYLLSQQSSYAQYHIHKKVFVTPPGRRQPIFQDGDVAQQIAYKPRNHPLQKLCSVQILFGWNPLFLLWATGRHQTHHMSALRELYPLNNWLAHLADQLNIHSTTDGPGMNLRLNFPSVISAEITYAKLTQVFAFPAIFLCLVLCLQKSFSSFINVHAMPCHSQSLY